MNRILITGATGNVGKEVIQSLLPHAHEHKIRAGVRDVAKDAKHFANTNIQPQHFDFENAATFKPALESCDVLFLLRPPQLADVKKYFKPLIETAKACGVQHIVFLSVQGVESNTLIPHYKIEQLIKSSGIAYTFMRPAYFMQNFTTTLRNDIVAKRLIFLPAGKAKFTLIDTADVGTATAAVLRHPQQHRNKSYELTNNERWNFGEMANTLSTALGTNIKYESPNLLRFFMQKRKEGMPVPFILVMIMLHYLPRFKKEPDVTSCVQMLTGKEPKSFDDFVREHKQLLT